MNIKYELISRRQVSGYISSLFQHSTERAGCSQKSAWQLDQSNGNIPIYVEGIGKTDVSSGKKPQTSTLCMLQVVNLQL